ncbi:putative Cytochrome c [Thiomonas arsenitoxydans]|uniref:Cytochrome c n=2 Tax=Thiomonas arsenitoxydans (strain DSM 22701 / CIP 110005 / 3As) TaxID=426114 RepID=D6CVM5_THIA3|nr:MULTISPECIES: cytochrome c [Thiomonas]MBN8744014.1 cytochrome c [Thiomonas arsenitoxydans]ODU89916.1 MAG: cytochrome C [Thiomonas sp. SCN 64-16]CAZ86806.1 putative Cytochrome c [Thiomonas arsenitoxydans]CQR28375.1 putative Cytochrome c [Thiomonas arsenitoxydans]CQR28503.1 putative Cytochrome c [Thiomonas arsenitoxydans]
MIRPMRQMRRALATCGLLAVLGAAWPLAQAAEAVPPQFVGANVAQGQKYYDNLKCAACHAQRMMGSSSAMYTRADRKVHNPQQLMAFTQMCVTQLNHDLFPEEVKDIAAYLNQTYYKFK